MPTIGTMKHTTPTAPKDHNNLDNTDEQLKFFRKVADEAPGLIGVYNIHTGEYKYVNKALASLLGYTPEDFVNGGLHFVTSIVHPDDLPLIMEKNAKVLAQANNIINRRTNNNQIVSFEYRIRHKNGKWHWFHTDGVVFERNKNGQVQQVMNISVDITTHKETELAALEKLRYHASLVDNVSDAVISTDLNFTIVSWNRSAERLYGWQEHEVIGRAITSFLHNEYSDSTADEQAVTQLLQTGLWTGDVVQRHKDGTPRHIAASVTIVKDAEGKNTGVIAINRDITERIQIEKRKDDFISIASHELKTPITSIKAFTQILQQMPEVKETKASKLLGRMDAQINRLTDLVSDLLDVSRIQTGRLELKQSEFDIVILTEHVAQDLEQVSKTHKITVTGSASCIMSGDRERIGQVITNLIENAVKYSPKSKTVNVSIEKQENQVVIGVKDFGIGISKNDVPYVFDRFYRASNTTESLPGQGLGLYISAEIVKRHGGSISIDSKKGKGSIFAVTLPINGTMSLKKSNSKTLSHINKEGSPYG